MPPTYYFSGINKPALLEILARHRANDMLNALSAGEPKLRDAYFHTYPAVELALDSAAVQGNQNVLRYVRLIKAIGKRMSWVSSLDSLHNQHKSDAQYVQLQELLADDACVLRRKVLWIYQAQSRGAHWHPDVW